MTCSDVPALSVQVLPVSGEDGIIDADETTADYSATRAYAFGQAHVRYTYGGTTLYIDKTNNSPLATPPTATAIAPGDNTGYTWTWSFSDATPTLQADAAGVVTLSGERAVLDENVSFTVTVTVSNGTATATSLPQEIMIRTTYVAPPLIEFDPATGLVTLSSASSPAEILYTLDGSNPLASTTAYTVPFRLSASPTTVRAVARRGADSYSDISERVCHLQLTPPTFSSVVLDINQGTVTLSPPTDGVTVANATILYTICGGDPQYTVNADGTIVPAAGTHTYSAPFTAPANEEIRAIAVDPAGGYLPSAIRRGAYYMPSGLYPIGDPTTVVLNDYEDHRWSYYSGDPDPGNPSEYRTPVPLRSLHPCNVKIEYHAGSVTNATAAALSPDMIDGVNEANINAYHYYKTLEKRDGKYPYTTIPNPYCMRPRTNGATGTNGFWGFNRWKVVSIEGGRIYRSNGTTEITAAGTDVANANNTIAAEEEILFVPNTTPEVNGTDITVVLEVDWATAYVVTTTADNLVDNLKSANLQGNSYELNFLVMTSGERTAATATSKQSAPVTITMRYPNGSDAGYSYNNCYISHNYTCFKPTKFEYINLRSNGTWKRKIRGQNTSGEDDIRFSARGTDLILGRGIRYSPSDNRSVNVNTIQGIDGGEGYTIGWTLNLNYTIRIESGKYSKVYFLDNYNAIYDDEYSGNAGEYPHDHPYYKGGPHNIKVVLGNDYDRARDRDSLEIKEHLYMARNIGFTDIDSRNSLFDATIKSGKILTNHWSAYATQSPYNAEAGKVFYLSCANAGHSADYPGRRRLLMEGGILNGIAGGVDVGNNLTDTSVYIRIKGGEIKGPVYGAAEHAETKGIRKLVITGGHIHGWVAGGCNGTTEGGEMEGDAYVYVGGNTIVGNTGDSAQYWINASMGGNVFAAGSGYIGDPESGRVENSIMVIADKAHIMENVYAGGNLGYTRLTAKVYMLGGIIEKSLFGGSNKKQGTNTEVYMYGGTVGKNVYGGSNEIGTISKNAKVTVSGGTVEGSVFGGGLGTDTHISGNVEVTIGYDSTTGVANRAVLPANQPHIKGDVYGGSQKGKVNKDAGNHTNVTINQGTIEGNVYGGGLGVAATNAAGAIEADVFGTVAVKVTGGYVENDVFGCNNLAGQPKNTVSVTIQGGSMENVYGGGNEAGYGDGLTASTQQAPKVLMTGGEVRSSVYGGGKGKKAILNEHTDVRVRGTATVGKNVYGGGNAAEVKGNTHVEIGGK